MTDEEINRQIHQAAFPDQWVIKKRGYYYRPNGCGYTDRNSEAWKLPLAEAKRHEYLRGEEPVTIHPALPLDYVNSEDAMRLVFKTIGDGPRLWKFLSLLNARLDRGQPMVFATARQEAMAFLDLMKEMPL